MRDYLLHGRRHGPQGSDPIPGLGVDFATLSFFGSSVTVSGAGTSVIPWNEFATTNTDVFATVAGTGSTPHNVTGDKGLLLLGAGVYIVMAAAQWESGAANVASFADIARGNNLTEIDFKAIELLAATTFAGQTQILNPSSFQMLNVFSGGTGLVSLNLQNFDVGSWDCVSAVMACIYWPSSDPATIY